MKASYAWLRGLVEGLELEPKALAERLTRAGLEVEAVTEFGPASRHVVLARVLAVEPHPQRSKLRVVDVDRGGGARARIVCGAPNVPAPGGLVVMAPMGTHLPAVGMTLAPKDIGGITGEGMLCSERELGLATPRKGAAAEGAHDDDPGILVLATEFTLPGGRDPVGATLAEAVPASHDWIFEIGVTPNRPDALGHRGLAREVAALTALAARPMPRELELAQAGEGRSVAVSIDDLERCPEYGGVLFENVTVRESPLAVRYRLEALGVRAISNVVDATNLLMLEFGHPTHAFDFDLLAGGRVTARRARPGETLKTLDGAERALVDDDLVIADAAGPVALAGVMGGERSEIRPGTTRVLLECALFAPRGVRRAARRHGMHTESSHRFERGVDTSGVARVLAEGARLLGEVAGAAQNAAVRAGAKPTATKTLELRKARLEQLSGATWDFAASLATLARLGCAVTNATDASATVALPAHRPDLGREVDLIEEVVRVAGLDAIPAVIPAIAPAEPDPADVERERAQAMKARLRRAALELGLSETVSYAFTSPRALEAVGAPRPVVKLANPLGEDRSVMRTSLLPGLLEGLARARRHGEHEVRAFALGSRFLARAEPTAGDEAALPDEVPSFAAVITGTRGGGLEKPVPLDVFDAKGLAVELVERATRRAVEVNQTAGSAAPAHLHPRGAGALAVEGRAVGVFGPLHPDVATAFELGAGAFVVELDVRALVALGLRVPTFRAIPALPAATRDIALVVHDDVPAGGVAGAIREAAGELCESVDVFDVFRGERMPADHRSLAFHVVYRDPNATRDPERARTLTDDEVDRVHKGVVAAVHAKFGATLRA